MKRIITIIAIAASTSARAQDYADSTITLTLTQRMAEYVAQHIRQSFTYEQRGLPEAIRPYLGSGTRPDSLFTVTIRAKLLAGGINQLISQPTVSGVDDFLRIIRNQPALQGYTGLAAQIIAKANGSSSDKQVATWLRDWYSARVAALEAVRDEERTRSKDNKVEQLSKQ